MLVEGSLRFDDFSNAWRIAGKRVVALAAVREQRARRLILRWPRDPAVDPPRFTARLKELLATASGGDCDVLIRYETDAARCVLGLDRAWAVRPTPRTDGRAGVAARPGRTAAAVRPGSQPRYDGRLFPVDAPGRIRRTRSPAIRRTLRGQWRPGRSSPPSRTPMNCSAAPCCRRRSRLGRHPRRPREGGRSPRPDRELYKQHRALRHLVQAQTGDTVTVPQVLVAGRGQQARSVIDGLNADVVTLALGQ